MGVSMLGPRRAPPTARGGRRGQLAVFDFVLLVPLLLLSVSLAYTIAQTYPVSSVDPATYETMARQTMELWLQGTVEQANVTIGTGTSFTVYSTPVSQLLTEIPFWVGCAGASTSTLSAPSQVAGGVLTELQELSGLTYSGASFSLNSSACGHPVSMSVGPAPPVGSASVYTAWSTLPGYGANAAPVAVGLYLWGA